MEGETLYLNGEFMPVSEGRIDVEDRGFQLGDGVYEVIRVMNGRLVWLAEHLDRLGRSLAAVRLAEALIGHPLESLLSELLDRSAVREGMVYVQVTRGAAPREFVFPHPPHPTVLAFAREVRLPDETEILEGAVLYPVEDVRWARCDIKSTNLLAAVLAKEEAWEAGAHEALFLGPSGVVREGGSSNVFALLEGVLCTHPADNRILAGITRNHVLEVAGRLGHAFEERFFTLSEVTGASDERCEVFTASTMKVVRPVVRIGADMIGDGRPGPVTLEIVDAIRREQAHLVGLRPPRALASRARR